MFPIQKLILLYPHSCVNNFFLLALPSLYAWLVLWAQLAFLRIGGFRKLFQTKVVGDAGFEPATSTVCRKHGKKKLKK